jgi:multidrug efflux system membrane fusion protein
MTDGTVQPKRFNLVRRRLWIVTLALVLAAVIGYGLAATSKDEADHPAGKSAQGGPPPRVVPVSAVAARTGEVRVYLDGIGTVTPLATVTVRTRVDGELVAVHFREGQMVKAGDLLAEIDPRPFQVQLEQAQGQMARDQALLANARVDLKRYKTLVAQNSIPKQQLDTQESLVRQYEAALTSDQAQIDQAKLQLTYSRVTAPVSGRLGLRLVDQGNIVHASDAGGLVVLTQVEPIAVVFPLPEDDLPLILPKLRAGEQLAVEAWDRDSQRQLSTGHVLTVDNAIDPTTGTVRVKAEFANEDEALFPNQFVNARLQLEVRRDATLVPSAAIQHSTEGTFVYLVGPKNTVELRQVKAGPAEQDDTSIESGLAAGDMVVVDGTLGLRAGTVVSLRTATPDGEAHKDS